MKLFTGINFQDNVIRQLALLKGSLPYVQWYFSDTYHLTLVFMGEINDYDLINDLDLPFKKISLLSFNITIESVNFFESSLDQIFWAGVQYSEELIYLQKKIEQCLKDFKIKVPKKKFVPHITLGRGSSLSKKQIQNWLKQYNLLKIQNIPITHFSLFSSYPNKEKPHYIIEKNYPLKTKHN